MNKLRRFVSAALLGGGLISSLLAGQWSFSYSAKSDGDYKTAEVYVPSACSVWAVVDVDQGSGEWKWVEYFPGEGRWECTPGFADGEVAVIGPNYAHNEIKTSPGADYLSTEGETTAGTYYVYAVGHTGVTGQVFIRVEISW